MKGRKRHILVDTLGLLLAVVVTSASISDPESSQVMIYIAITRLMLRRLVTVV